MKSPTSSKSTSTFRPPVQIVKGDAADRLNQLLGPGVTAELAAITQRLAREFALEEGTKINTCPTCQKREVVWTKDQLVLDPVAKNMVVDPRCADCKHAMKEACPIVCHNCREMIMWTEPGPKAYGYVAAKGRFLHAAACPKCLDLFMVKKGVRVDAPVLEYRAAYCAEKGLDLQVYLRDWFTRLDERRRAVNAESPNQPNA